jgi:hypothetical protein
MTTWIKIESYYEPDLSDDKEYIFRFKKPQGNILFAFGSIMNEDGENCIFVVYSGDNDEDDFCISLEEFDYYTEDLTFLNNMVILDNNKSFVEYDKEVK